MRELSTLMQLPELLKRQAIKQLDRFCTESACSQPQPRLVRYRLEGEQINLFEVRSTCCNSDPSQDLPLAQLRYNVHLNQWTLHHQNGHYWQLYLNVNPTLQLGKLLLAIKQDPLGYFWAK